jgi:hypothetical protein
MRKRSIKLHFGSQQAWVVGAGLLSLCGEFYLTLSITALKTILTTSHAVNQANARQVRP